MVKIIDVIHMRFFSCRNKEEWVLGSVDTVQYGVKLRGGMWNEAVDDTRTSLNEDESVCTVTNTCF